LIIVHSPLYLTRSLIISAALLWSSGRSQTNDQRTNFFLPKYPVAAAYVLGRLSNQELIQAPRSEFVYVALLQRAGLDRKYRLEAMDGLAGIRHTDPLTELIAGLLELDKKGGEMAATLRDFAPILLQSKPQELSHKREALAKLVSEAQLALTRQIADAALITADGSIDGLWNEAEAKPAQLTDLLLSVPMVRDGSVRSAAYPKVEPLLARAESPEVRRAAIMAIASIPGHEAESFKTIAAFVQNGTERETGIAALEQIPQSFWPKETAATLVGSLLDHLQHVPANERTGPDFTSALQFATDLAALLPPDEGEKILKNLRGLGPTVIALRAVYEQLRYDKSLIVVEANKPVALVLDNQDAMPHNLAILAPGALEEIGQAAEKMPAEPDVEGRLYIPASPKVLHATKLAAPGQKVQLAFTAPPELGEYPYVCTFPGHWRRMTGFMVVVNDVADYLATHAQSAQPKLTEWKLQDLSPDLAKAAFGRNLENGKKLFTHLACAQCHKLGAEGYAFGPELTDVFARYTNDRNSVLEQILEPSKVIEDRYRNFSFEIKNGEPITGIVLKEDAQTVTIQTGPADSLIQKLNKSDIEKRSRQNSSPMPVGLVNSLSKEEIFDLLAFLESGGKIEVHEHKH